MNRSREFLRKNMHEGMMAEYIRSETDRIINCLVSALRCLDTICHRCSERSSNHQTIRRTARNDMRGRQHSGILYGSSVRCMHCGLDIRKQIRTKS